MAQKRRKRDLNCNPMKNNEKKSRRNFLGLGLKIGAATAAGGLATAKVLGDSHSEEEMVELMTTDGTLVQVPAGDVSEIPVKADYNVREGYANKKFVMVVDLAK